jgi:hypothetical protein
MNVLPGIFDERWSRDDEKFNLPSGVVLQEA